jgi:general stress protein 26
MTLKEKILAVMGGVHVAAIATIADGRPAVRFMALTGFEDTSLVGATVKSSRKVQQLKKNQDAALSIWSCREYSDPYIVIQAKGTIHEDFATKKKYWDPMLEPFFRSPENPDYVVLKFIPERIEYYDMSGMEVWER